MAGHCEEHGELIRMLREIHTAIQGDMTDENSEGMRPMLMRHDRFIKGVDKVKWLIVGTLTTSLITGLTGVFFYVVRPTVGYGQHTTGTEQSFARTNNRNSGNRDTENPVGICQEIWTGSNKDEEWWGSDDR